MNGIGNRARGIDNIRAWPNDDGMDCTAIGAVIMAIIEARRLGHCDGDSKLGRMMLVGEGYGWRDRHALRRLVRSDAPLDGPVAPAICPLAEKVLEHFRAVT